VTIVVPVLMTSCQVSENPKTGPVIAQTRTTPTANTKVEGRPVCLAVRCAPLSNKALIEFAIDHPAFERRGRRLLTASPHPGRRRVFTGGYTSDIGKATARLHPAGAGKAAGDAIVTTANDGVGENLG
jgi:hypothetical protein